MRRSLSVPLTLLTLLAGLAGLVGLAGTGFSDATFTSSSRTTATVRAAADWTAPTVAVTAASSLQGTVTVGATASDAESGIASVTLQYATAGGSAWTTLCTDTTAPYSCAWDTRTVTDGGYDLRAGAVDKSGYSTVSEPYRTTVANKVVVVLTDPGEVLRGSVQLSATVHNGALLTLTVRMEYAVAGSGVWRTACTGLGNSASCTWSTTGAGNGTYDLRAVALYGVSTVYSAVIPDVEVDNTAPTVTIVDPGTPLRGTVTLTANAADADSGVSQVAISAQLTGAATWQPVCTVTAEPFSCSFATTTLADGVYSFRAVATDAAGNTTTSSSVTNRKIDNTVSSVSVDDPGAYLTGTVTVTAQANSTAGIVSVRLQRAPTGTTTWTDLCTDTTAPYSCAWATTTVADGGYDLRAILVDGRGTTTTSAVVSARRVDNSPLRGADVQAVNGSGTAGRLDAGDTVTLTYSGTIALGTVTSGWTGSALPVTLRLRDGNTLGLGSRGDSLDVLRGTAAVALGSVNLRENYIKANKAAAFNATMTAATVTVDGVQRTVVTLVVGTQASGNGLRTVSASSAMTWTPSAAATSPTGTACSTAPATESGAADRQL